MATTTDPVCKMDVETKDAEATTKHKGETYYFCCSQCKDKFEKEPEHYASSKKEAAPQIGTAARARLQAGLSSQQKRGRLCFTVSFTPQRLWPARRRPATPRSGQSRRPQLEPLGEW